VPEAFALPSLPPLADALVQTIEADEATRFALKTDVSTYEGGGSFHVGPLRIERTGDGAVIVRDAVRDGFPSHPLERRLTLLRGGEWCRYRRNSRDALEDTWHYQLVVVSVGAAKAGVSCDWFVSSSPDVVVDERVRLR
jgi:hypothetical protein